MINLVAAYSAALVLAFAWLYFVFRNEKATRPHMCQILVYFVVFLIFTSTRTIYFTEVNNLYLIRWIALGLLAIYSLIFLKYISSPGVFLMIAFAITNLWSASMAADPYEAFFRTGSYVLLALAALARWNHPRATILSIFRALEMLGIAIVSASFIMTAMGIADERDPGRYQGCFVNCNDLAATCVLVLIAGLSLHSVQPLKWRRVINSATFIVLCVTGSRGALLSTFIVVVFLYLSKAASYIIPLAILIGVTCISLIYDPDWYSRVDISNLTREQSLAAAGGWSSYRVDNLEKAKELISRNKWFGIGLGNTPDGEVSFSGKTRDRALRQVGYPLLAVESGLLGCIVFIGIVAYPLMTAVLTDVMKGDKCFRGAFALLLGVAVMGLYESFPASVGCVATVAEFIILGPIFELCALTKRRSRMVFVQGQPNTNPFQSADTVRKGPER